MPSSVKMIFSKFKIGQAYNPNYSTFDLFFTFKTHAYRALEIPLASSPLHICCYADMERYPHNLEIQGLWHHITKTGFSCKASLPMPTGNIHRYVELQKLRKELSNIKWSMTRIFVGILLRNYWCSLKCTDHMNHDSKSVNGPWIAFSAEQWYRLIAFSIHTVQNVLNVAIYKFFAL